MRGGARPYSGRKSLLEQYGLADRESYGPKERAKLEATAVVARIPDISVIFGNGDQGNILAKFMDYKGGRSQFLRGVFFLYLLSQDGRHEIRDFLVSLFDNKETREQYATAINNLAEKSIKTSFGEYMTAKKECIELIELTEGQHNEIIENTTKAIQKSMKTVWNIIDNLCTRTVNIADIVVWSKGISSRLDLIQCSLIFHSEGKTNVFSSEYSERIKNLRNDVFLLAAFFEINGLLILKVEEKIKIKFLNTLVEIMNELHLMEHMHLSEKNYEAFPPILEKTYSYLNDAITALFNYEREQSQGKNHAQCQ